MKLNLQLGILYSFLSQFTFAFIDHNHLVKNYDTEYRPILTKIGLGTSYVFEGLTMINA